MKTSIISKNTNLSPRPPTTFKYGLLAGLLLTLSAYVGAQESSVKIFGELDIALVHSKATTGLSTTAIDSGSNQQSHFGFALHERLNADYQLQVRLDSFVNVDTGNTQANTFWSRESSLSIKNKELSISLGKNLSPIFDHAVGFNSFNNARLAPLFSIVGFATTHPLNPAQDNSVRLDWQPNANYHASYLYRFSETANSMYWTAAFAYHQPKTSVGLAIDHSAPLGGQGSLYSVLASASHEIDYAKLYLNILGQKDSNLQQRSWGGEFGLVAPVTGGNVKFSFAKGSKSPINNGKLSQLTTSALAYEYILSKRSILYLSGQVQQRENIVNTHTLALGINHRF